MQPADVDARGLAQRGEHVRRRHGVDPAQRGPHFLVRHPPDTPPCPDFPPAWTRPRDDDTEAQVRQAAQAGEGDVRPAVETGTVRCWRCGRVIHPAQAWDLGHVDGDPSRYPGPEHARCNRATAAHAVQRRNGGAVVPGVVSVAWRSSYPAGWAPDATPENQVPDWSRHWGGCPFNPRCPACRARGSACVRVIVLGEA